MNTQSTDFLLQGPFGDPDALRTDLEVFHTGLVDMLGRSTGVNMPVVNESLLGRSIWRTHLDKAFKACVIRQDPGAAREILQQGVLLLSRTGDQIEFPVHDKSYNLAGNWTQLEPGLLQIHAVQNDLLPHNMVPIDATRDHAAKVAEGVKLLVAALGELAVTTMRSVSGALIIECDAIGSAFIVPVPEVSILNQSLLGDPVAVADAVIHEACHQKLYDLIAVRRLLKPGYGGPGERTYTIPWNPVNGKRRRMDSLMILSALHVYAHVMALIISLARMGYRHPTVSADLETYWRRARFFWLIAEKGSMSEDLGPDAAAMLDWLIDTFRRHAYDMRTLGRPIDNTYLRDAERQAVTTDV
ncbi:hypothetical protein [Streptosporangium sp. NPDC049644]|uniref:hypothetical protein n=1 Tax=Streptosporangium sp. NPDC049644 TaxID=3155507 RepID=UPI003413BE96